MIESEPSIRALLQQDDAYLWCEAIDSKVAFLHSHCIFHPVVDQSKVITTKLVLVKKQNYRDVVEGYKARLVAKGFFQGPEFDFDAESTYAPTVDLYVLGLLLSNTANVDLVIWQYDVKTAYLERELDPPVLVRLPRGITLIDGVLTFNPFMIDVDSVMHLVEALPRLCQSASEWHAILDKRLQGIRIVGCKQDPTVYILGSSISRVFLTAWVDDLTLFRRAEYLKKLRTELDSLFELQFLDYAHYLFTITIRHGKKRGVLVD